METITIIEPDQLKRLRSLYPMVDREDWNQQSGVLYFVKEELRRIRLHDTEYAEGAAHG